MKLGSAGALAHIGQSREYTQNRSPVHVLALSSYLVQVNTRFKHFHVENLVIRHNNLIIHIVCTFVEDAPDSFFLRQEPVVEARHLFEVRTGADEQQPKHQDAIERINCG